MKARIEDKVVYSPYPDIQIPVLSFFSLMRERLQIKPDKLAVVDDMLSLTRSELLVRLQRYAVGFRRHGVLPGDRVCIHLRDSVKNMVAMYGCVVAGATIVMAKTSLAEHDLRYQAEDSDSTHILTDVEFTEKVVKATASLRMKGFFAMGTAAGFVSAAGFPSLDERDFQECPVADPKSTTLALCYTSGSTGMPKGVEITHYNLVSCFYVMSEHMPWAEGETALSANPITHMSGMVLSIMPALNGSVSVILSSKSTPGEVINAIDKYKVTVMVSFPTQLQSLVRNMRQTGRRLPSMRCISIAGAALTSTLAEQACSSFGGLRTLQPLYGTTEACVLVAVQPMDLDISQRGSDNGFPMTTTSIKVVDIATREKLGPHQMGEICFRNASMVRGYYKMPKATAELFDKDGWMKSGDAGYYDEDGRLYFAERLKQLIKCMDNQVVPGELEELLLRKHTHEISEVCVIGLPHAEYGEAAAAAIVLSEEGRKQQRYDLAKRIKETVSDTLAVHKHLYGGLFFVESLPRTDNSKVNRPALVRSLLSGH
ncbi:putative 4-coumarate--CoA ligase 1 [Haemaphysalis longicornis]